MLGLSKPLTQDTDDGTNAFSITEALSVLDQVNELIDNSDAAAGFTYSMSEATAALQTQMDADPAYSTAAAALAQETGHQAALQIGDTQTVSFTFAGTDLMGTGTDNVCFILDKCISLIQTGDTAGLSGMISDVQGAQSRALCFETQIGTTENRMSMIDSRYDSSVLNYTQMQSDAVDVDMAEAIVNFTTAQTVYSAALAAGAEIVQTSLIDFIS